MLVPFIMIGLVVITGIVIWLDDAQMHNNTHD
jgi:hypothetical protein